MDWAPSMPVRLLYPFSVVEIPVMVREMVVCLDSSLWLLRLFGRLSWTDPIREIQFYRQGRQAPLSPRFGTTNSGSGHSASSTWPAAKPAGETPSW